MMIQIKSCYTTYHHHTLYILSPRMVILSTKSKIMKYTVINTVICLCLTDVKVKVSIYKKENPEIFVLPQHRGWAPSIRLQGQGFDSHRTQWWGHQRAIGEEMRGRADQECRKAVQNRRSSRRSRFLYFSVLQEFLAGTVQ